MNENENTTIQNLWDTVKAVLMEGSQQYRHTSRNKKKNQINNLHSTPKATRKGRNEEPQGQQKERNLKNQGRNKYKRNHSKNQQSQKLIL